MISNLKYHRDRYGDLQITLHYQAIKGFKALRKWIEIKNVGDKWLKISDLYLEPLAFSFDFQTVYLTPKNRDCDPSILGLDSKDHTFGIIIACEIPSALRLLSDNGVCGYSSTLFEWILGPNEIFTSEAVIYYTYSGPRLKFGHCYSTPLDRCIESEFLSFLTSNIGIAASEVEIPAPVYCTWSNLVANINDDNIRELASDAERCGFRTFQIDAGWSESPDLSDWTAGSTEPHPSKFPHFTETCRFIKEKGMHLGLWLSCFRNPESRDLQEIPNGRSIPIIKRGHAYGMSYASRWREYYAQDVIRLTDQIGATYYKQDLTNVKFGDFARGHESRSQKESVLRCLRGLLWTQEQIRKARPNVWTMLSHEIYWGTPGAPCDLAAIKSACGYHIPPNDYSGCGPRKLRWNPSWKSPFKLNKITLLKGCMNARNRFYEHRGLPLFTLEYFGAATINIDNTLTETIQDRQICSWLMGMPSVFAGDLASLSDSQKAHYKKRFDLLSGLNEKYGIYRYFQYSGAPKPTDKGWHWWGKLNPNHEGIVVVLRGALGSTKKKIFIPWLHPTTQYYIRFCFKYMELGPFLGSELMNGALSLQLKRFDQEIIEVSTAPFH